MTTEGAGPDPTSSLRATFRGISSIVAPTSAVTALLYYFGWTRTSVEATQLGLDDSLLGYSTSDYLLRSMSSMLAPLVIVLVVTLAGFAFHASVGGWARRLSPPGEDSAADETGRRPLGRLVASIAGVGLVLLALGIVGSQLRHPTPNLYVASPVGVTVGIAMLIYAAYFIAASSPRATPRPRRAPTGTTWSSSLRSSCS